MNPLIRLNLPSLSDGVCSKLMDLSKDHKNFSYSRNTLGSIKQKAEQEGDRETLEILENLKQIYGFTDLPQHRACNVSKDLVAQIEDELGITFPANTGIFIQVVDCENTFIHTDGGSRKASFYYMLTDDTDAETRFYKSDKPPIYSTIWHPMDVYQYYSYKMKQNEWHTFSHDEIHSVNNVKQLRVGLLIDMTRAFPDYNSFVEHFKCLM